MQPNQTLKWLASIGALAVFASFAIYQWTRPPTIDTDQAAAVIVRQLKSNGLDGTAECPPAKRVIGERIGCRAALVGGEAGGQVVDFGIVPTDEENVHVVGEELLYHRTMLHLAEQVESSAPITKIECPASRVFREGDVATCTLAADDGSDFTIDIHYVNATEVRSTLGTRVIDTTELSESLEAKPELAGYRVDCGPQFRQLDVDDSWTCRAKRRDVSLYVTVRGEPQAGSYRWSID